jgi:hypothetical protein
MSTARALVESLGGEIFIETTQDGSNENGTRV